MKVLFCFFLLFSLFLSRPFVLLAADEKTDKTVEKTRDDYQISEDLLPLFPRAATKKSASASLISGSSGMLLCLGLLGSGLAVLHQGSKNSFETYHLATAVLMINSSFIGGAMFSLPMARGIRFFRETKQVFSPQDQNTK